MSDMTILIGGEAGQGLVTIGSLMTKALVRSGYEILVTQDYMSRIRGGHNTYGVRFGPEPVNAPRESVDVLVALSEDTVRLYRDKLSKRGVIVTYEGIETGYERTFSVPFKELAPKPIFHNTVALGVLASIVCSEMNVLEDLLAQTFRKKGDEVVQQNLDVLRTAVKWKEDNEILFECPAPPEGSGNRLTLNGNEAIALGAIAAGCDFCSFYPMTPSTSVALNLIAHSAKAGIIVEQVEDEIAALNMALGASYAGARPMVTTSGGGFALMTEAVSLAGMIETPVVVAVVQRPGPATGLPTRTEQGDLNLVLYAGHGEFPRAVFAPGTVEECFSLTHRAFAQAEKYQSPVFVLSDQYLADSYRAVAPFNLDLLPDVPRPLAVPENPETYERFSHEGDRGVSPRAVPGLSRALVVVDSDEHTPDGHITEDHEVRVRMVDKRNRKACGIFEDIQPPTFIGDDDADVVLVCWGSTLGPCVETSEILRAKGKKAGVLHFSQVYPLNPVGFMERLESAARVVCVEGNYTGQFAGLLRRETGFAISDLVLRYDGLPFTPAYILSGLECLD